MSSRRLLFYLASSLLLILLGWQIGVLQAGTGGRVRVLSGRDLELVHPGETASGITVRNPKEEVDISLLWETWEALNERYIDPKKLQVTPLVYGAVEGLTRAIGDPYTVFMTPKEDQEFREGLAGNLEGIGAELTMQEEQIVIVTPLRGSPAERAGLQARDVIASVNGESTEGWSLGDVVSRIRGPKGTPVRIGIIRERKEPGKKLPKAETMEFTITRAAIHVPSVEAEIIKKGKKTIGLAALNQFGQDSIGELKREMQKFKDQKVDGIILDLRNNGGGYLDGALELVSLFLPEGEVVKVARYEGDMDLKKVSGKALLPTMPLVIIQNEATASASEIVSGALQDHGRATIVGLKSFGKGTVQEVVELSGGASLRVTVARWLTPKGRDLSKEGVVPDVIVEGKKPNGLEEEKDPQLEAAVGVLLQ